jgi:hypothetical protein
MAEIAAIPVIAAMAAIKKHPAAKVRTAAHREYPLVVMIAILSE